MCGGSGGRGSIHGQCRVHPFSAWRKYRYVLACLCLLSLLTSCLHYLSIYGSAIFHQQVLLLLRLAANHQSPLFRPSPKSRTRTSVSFLASAKLMLPSAVLFCVHPCAHECVCGWVC